MKVFIRSSNLVAGDHNIPVVGYYDDATEIPADAHGEGMTVLTVSQQALTTDKITKMPMLRSDWRERSGAEVMRAEARRRTDEMLPVEKSVIALYELMSLVVAHGNDPANWPSDAHDRWALLDQQFKYVQEVQRVAAAFPQAPVNPTSDEHWPTKPRR